MKDFSDKLAVVTGGGAGIGRELVRALVAEGCDVAMCDVLGDNMEETRQLAAAEASNGRRITAHLCDVSNRADVDRFAREVSEQHSTKHINLLFNNAGVGAGGSFVDGECDNWERTFNICWGGVYNCARAFMPMLVAADQAHMINVSSINGFWASLGPQSTHTAYSAAKFAVKGFTEALITDLKNNAPHVKCSVVMPGYIGTSIVLNSSIIVNGAKSSNLADADLSKMRAHAKRAGLPVDQMTDDQVLEEISAMGVAYRDNARTTAEQAAEIILSGVREERWRILVGEDAYVLDQHVRADPENAYTDEFFERLQETGKFGAPS